MSNLRFFFLISALSFLLLAPFAYFRQKRESTKVAVPKYETAPLLEEKLLKKLQAAPLLREKASQNVEVSTYSAHGGRYAKITPDFFRCRGSSIHPAVPVLRDGKVVENIFDCGGTGAHSLSVRDGKEYIFPVLLDLLNEIQQKTKKQVVITSGHHCPQHHRYVTARGASSSVKHMIGAAVTFYVVGLEKAQEEVLKVIANYYQNYPVSEKERTKYTEFVRSDKCEDKATIAWYNKEVFIKFYKDREGRDADNMHPFPYFSIQVRFDRELNKEVVFKHTDAETIFRY